MAKLYWTNLTKKERSRYMYLQTAPSNSYGGGGYLPDDCSECGACSQPTLGSGLCHNCYTEWQALRDKLTGKALEGK